MVAEVRQNRALQLSGFIQAWLNWIGPILGLLLVILIFSVLMDSPGRYLSPFNLRIVCADCDSRNRRDRHDADHHRGGIDLGQPVIALTGDHALTNAGLSPLMAVAAGILVGGSVGVVNGLVITRLELCLHRHPGNAGSCPWYSQMVCRKQTVNVPEHGLTNYS